MGLLGIFDCYSRQMNETQIKFFHSVLFSEINKRVGWIFFSHLYSRWKSGFEGKFSEINKRGGPNKIVQQLFPPKNNKICCTIIWQVRVFICFRTLCLCLILVVLLAMPIGKKVHCDSSLQEQNWVSFIHEREGREWGQRFWLNTAYYYYVIQLGFIKIL